MKKKVIELIEKYDKIIILRHVRPDPDAYGSQLGLKELILKNYPNKTVLADGEHDDLLTYLGRLDTVEKTDYKDALIIITDTANTERIDSLYHKEGAFILKIDHHPEVDKYADVNWVDTTASSTSELIVELFEYAEKHSGWTMTEQIARLLFAGIVGDTGRFMYPSTTKKTFQRASKLITYHFDRAQLFDQMYEVERKVLDLQGYIFQNLVLDENGAGYVKVAKDILERFNVTPNESSHLVSTLGNIKGISAWVLFIEEEDVIRVRLRSKNLVINELAAEYNGGGHPLASGASVKSWDEADELIGKLKELCRLNRAE